MLQILHNPRCGKSRDCLAFIAKSTIPFEIIKYLENPLTVDDLKVLLKKLNLKPIDIVRQKEVIWTENYKAKSMTDAAILKAIAQHPILMQRPILIDGSTAIIGREIDKIADFLK